MDMLIQLHFTSRFTALNLSQTWSSVAMSYVAVHEMSACCMSVHTFSQSSAPDSCLQLLSFTSSVFFPLNFTPALAEHTR